MLLFQGGQGEECGAYLKYVSNSESAGPTKKELHYPAITKKVAECCYFKADKARSAEHTLAYVSSSESASLTQKELHYPAR